MSELCIDEFDALHATIADAEKKCAHAALYGTVEAVIREKDRIAEARERLKYYDVAALLATMKWRTENPDWQPIATMPTDDTLFLAVRADGAMMIWKGSLLHEAGKPRTPEHLKFAATHWMPLPCFPATAASVEPPK